MFTIRDQQLTMFGRHMEQQYEARLLRHVEEQFPEKAQALGRPDLRTRLRRLTRAAQGYGITSEQGIALYVDACLALDGDPRTHPWAARILDDPALDGNTKARRFCDRTVLYLEGGLAP